MFGVKPVSMRKQIEALIREMIDSIS